MEAPGVLISSYAWKVENRTGGIDLEGSWSRRKPKKASYKGSRSRRKLAKKSKKKIDQKVKNPDQNRLIAQTPSHLWT